MVDEQRKLIELLEGFDTAMLVTRAPDGSLCGRPMAIADVEPDGDLWFVTDQHSGKVHDVALKDEVAITMQSSNRFVSLSGRAHPERDRAKLDQIWQESWKVWFPEGKDSPSLLLLKVDADQGEYWDNSGATGIKYLLKAGKAYLQGDRPQTDRATNASVKLD